MKKVFLSLAVVALLTACAEKAAKEGTEKTKTETPAKGGTAKDVKSDTTKAATETPAKGE